MTLTPRLELRVLGRRRSAFRVWGVTGVVAAVALAQGVTAATGGSAAVMAAVSLAGMATFLALVAAGVVWNGEERLVYYHHEIAVLAVAGATAALLGGPVLPYLDATAVGLGAFLACGRVGCLMVGCCHGRPHPRGVTYSPAHGEAGLTAAYVGVPLFPVQAVESAWALALAAAGTALVLAGAAPGTAFALYVTGYAAARFALELVRGDAGRAAALGLTQAQWLSLACTAGIVAAGAAGLAPAHPAHAVVGVALALAAAALAGRDRSLSDAAHAQELFGAVRASLAAAPAHVVETSAGVAVSGGVLDTPAGPLRHVSVSRRGGPVPGALGHAVRNDVRALAPGAGAGELRRGSAGVLHVLVR